MKLLDGIQRRVTRLVPQLKDKTYEVRLVKLGLTSLEEREKRGDMIEMYKIITRKEKVDPRKLFQMDANRGRSH